MSRPELAYILMLLFGVAALAVIIFTTRYKRYRRTVARGRGRPKPVWKPFWMS